MAYRKFDEATKSVSQAPRKLYAAMPWEAFRRAIQGITNRVVSGTGGTGGSGLMADLGTGSTCGVRLKADVLVSINGRVGTASAQDNIYLPDGTQGSGTYVKYLIAVKHGTRGTVFAGNEGASSTGAYLPDCPDGYCAIGYVEYYTDSGAFGRLGGGTAGAQNVLSGNVAATCGTVKDWESLIHMPYDEVLV